MTLIDIKGVDPRTLSPSELRQYRICMAAWFGYFHRDEIEYDSPGYGYSEAVRHPPPAVPNHIDCSTFATYCYAVAGSPNPNTGGFGVQDYIDHYPSTMTLWPKGILIGGTNVNVSKLRPGDLIFYGDSGISNFGVGGPGEHVSVYVGRGIQISHGSDSGPKRLGWRDTSHAGVIGVRRYAW